MDEEESAALVQKPSLVIVEDSEKLAASLKRGLEEEGFLVETFHAAGPAVARIARGDVDAVVLDLGLPDADGIEVITELRADAAPVPVLVLTARDAIESRVVALERGADDYLVKPFAFAELLARLRALLRRAAAPRWAPLSFQGLRFTPGRETCRVQEQHVTLSPKERSLLELFLRHRGEVLSYRRILSEVFDYEFDPGTNIVAVHVGNLRRKIVGGGVHLQAVRKVGYRMVPDDRSSQQEPRAEPKAK